VCSDKLADRLRRSDAERVDDYHLARAGLDGRGVDAVVEVALRARRVDAEERRMDVVLGGEAHRVRDPVEHLLARDADRLELQVGDRRLDHREANVELGERLEVGGNGAREAPHLGPKARGGDSLDGVPVVLRDAREPRLDSLDAEVVEEAGDLDLLVGVEHDADRLLAVAQGRVVEPDAAADLVRIVQLTGPDQVVLHCATTPSGNAESFFAPAAVIRKLSSTRSPPPPSQ